MAFSEDCVKKLSKVGVEINEEKTKEVDLRKGGKFEFLGFEFRRNVNQKGKGWPHYQPKMSARTETFEKTQRSIQSVHISTSEQGCSTYQFHIARMGSLLSGRSFKQMF